MNIDEIKELVNLLEQSSLVEMDIQMVILKFASAVRARLFRLNHSTYQSLNQMQQSPLLTQKIVTKNLSPHPLLEPFTLLPVQISRPLSELEIN